MAAEQLGAQRLRATWEAAERAKENEAFAAGEGCGDVCGEWWLYGLYEDGYNDGYIVFVVWVMMEL